MQKWMHVSIGALATGLVQFSILVSSGVTQTLPLIAGVAGAIGAGITLHLKQVPRKEWSKADRKLKGEKS